MTEENQETDTFFEGMDETEINEPEAIEGEVESTTGEPETETETAQAEEETETDTAPPAEKDTSLVPKAAMLDERRKRQQLQEENENLRKQIPKTENKVDFYDSDKEAYDAALKAEWEAEQQKIRQKEQTTWLNESRSKMLENHNDFPEMEVIFEIMTASNASLVEDMLRSNDPAKFAYDTAKTYKESLLGNQVKTQETQESEPSEAEKRNKSVVEAPSLATATATASNTVELEKEATIDDIFADVTY